MVEKQRVGAQAAQIKGRPLPLQRGPEVLRELGQNPGAKGQMCKVIGHGIFFLSKDKQSGGLRPAGLSNGRQPPRYAFLTASSARSSAPVPEVTMRPVSST